jgi:hypothetical protein
MMVAVSGCVCSMDVKGKKYNLMLEKGQFGRKCKLFLGQRLQEC